MEPKKKKKLQELLTTFSRKFHFSSNFSWSFFIFLDPLGHTIITSIKSAFWTFHTTSLHF